MMQNYSDILQIISSREKVEIELGCGPNKRHHSALGIDALNFPGVDLVGDVYEVLACFPANSVDSIFAYHFMEHVPDFKLLIQELFRVLKVNGTLVFTVPHFSNPYYFSDISHKNFFGIYTMSYFLNTSYFSRKVPNYGLVLDFRIRSIDIVFKSTRPFYIRHAFKYVLGVFFNSSNFLKEFYEENLCYLFPCYEIKFALKKSA